MTAEGTCFKDPSEFKPSAFRVWTDDRHRFEVCLDEMDRVAGKHERFSYQQRFTLIGRIGRIFGAE